MATTIGAPALGAAPDTRWRTRDIVVAAVIGVAFGVVFWASGPASGAAARRCPAPAAPGPRCTASGCCPRSLAPLIIRKPGRRAVRRDGRGRRVGAARQRLGRRHAALRVRPGRGRRARLRVHPLPASGPSRSWPSPALASAAAAWVHDWSSTTRATRPTSSSSRRPVDGDLGDRARRRGSLALVARAPARRRARGVPGLTPSAAPAAPGAILARAGLGFTYAGATARRCRTLVRGRRRARACSSSGRRGRARARSPWRSPASSRARSRGPWTGSLTVDGLESATTAPGRAGGAGRARVPGSRRPARHGPGRGRRRVRAREPGLAAGRDASRACPRRSAAVGLGGLRAPRAPRAVGRPAAAARAGRRAGAAPGRPRPRRADREPRSRRRARRSWRLARARGRAVADDRAHRAPGRRRVAARRPRPGARVGRARRSTSGRRMTSLARSGGADGRGRDLAAGTSRSASRRRRPRGRRRRRTSRRSLDARRTVAFAYDRGAPGPPRRRPRRRGRASGSPSSGRTAAASRRSAGCSSACSARRRHGPPRRPRPGRLAAADARPTRRLRLPGSRAAVPRPARRATRSARPRRRRARRGRGADGRASVCPSAVRRAQPVPAVRRRAAATVAGVRPRPRPAVLVLDEPTFGQDRHGYEGLLAILGEHVDAGRALIAATHDERFVARRRRPGRRRSTTGWIVATTRSVRVIAATTSSADDAQLASVARADQPARQAGDRARRG